MKVRILINGNSKTGYDKLSMIKVVLVLSLNEMIKRVISAISANAIKALVHSSASNNPVNKKRPKGILIISPCKKMKK